MTRARPPWSPGPPPPIICSPMVIPSWPHLRTVSRSEARRTPGAIRPRAIAAGRSRDRDAGGGLSRRSRDHRRRTRSAGCVPRRLHRRQQDGHRCPREPDCLRDLLDPTAFKKGRQASSPRSHGRAWRSTGPGHQSLCPVPSPHRPLGPAHTQARPRYRFGKGTGTPATFPTFVEPTRLYPRAWTARSTWRTRAL
jgi:hypothetical protein